MRYGKYMDTLVGKLYMAEEEGCLVELSDRAAQPGDCIRDTELLMCTTRQLQEYFAGIRCEFDIPVCGKGTVFQESVWKALCDIPYGETRTYGQIAVAVGQPKASRAVGGACNKNLIMIVIPCHRVIGTNGKLVGFGGGLPMKKALLALEGISAKE